MKRAATCGHCDGHEQQTTDRLQHNCEITRFVGTIEQLRRQQDEAA